MSLEAEVMGVDMVEFLDIQQEYSQPGVSPIIMKYLDIVQHLYGSIPHQKPCWYQAEALRRTKIYYKAHKNDKKS